MSRHRNAGASRTISRGPVIGVASGLVLALVVLGWFQVRGNIDEQSAEAAALCVDGTSALAVVADPDVAPALTELAQRYTASEPVVRDQCISVTVTAAGPGAVLAGLRGSWDTTTLGPRPAVWVAADSATATQVPVDGEVARTEEPPSLTSSPVVLAAPAPVAEALGSAGAIDWARLAELQAADEGWAALGEPGWGALTVALPAGSAANVGALQAVAATVAGTPPTAETVVEPAVANAVSALGRGEDPQPANLGAALDTLGALTDPTGSGYQLVPATAQQVQAHGDDLVATSPDGATAALDYPYVALTAPWIDDTQARAAGAWREYLSQPAQQQTLAAAGFTAADGVGPVPDAMAPADTGLATALVDAASTPPPLAARATVLLDVSGSTAVDVGDTTRLGATAAALRTRFDELPDDTAVGLWTFSTALDGDLPYRALVPAAAVADDQRSALADALAGLEPESATSLYASVTAAYAAALTDADPDAPDSVLVITDGPDDDPSTSSADLLATIADRGGADAGVRIDVITLGEADSTTLGGIAAATGGTLVDVGDAGTPELSAALSRLLL